jgi:glucose 1-dehydrogenase
MTSTKSDHAEERPEPRLLTLRESVVWVTGASSGIGRAIAKAFTEAGASVVATDVRPLDDTPAMRRVPCNVSDPASVLETSKICDEIGGASILVNCAGVLSRDDIFTVTPEIWDRVYAVNVFGPYLCSQALARSLIRRNTAGCIINISSVNADIVFPETVAYCSSKGALNAMTRGLSVGLAPHHIRANSIAPGAIVDTDLEKERWMVEANRADMRSRTPLGILGRSVDIAAAAVYLASPEARFITGANLVVDGGRMAAA